MKNKDEKNETGEGMFKYGTPEINSQMKGTEGVTRKSKKTEKNPKPPKVKQRA